MKSNNAIRGITVAVVLHLGVLAGSAQTYLYSYTGNDFTSASGPYTTSDKITANLILSAPLGANYEGSPSATLLNFGINDGVYQDLPSLPNNYVQDFTFGTDSSGDIVSWNFEMISFHEYLQPIQTVTMITIDQPGDVMDSTSIDTQFANLGGGVGAIRSGCVGGNSRAGTISRSFISLVRAVGFGTRAVQALAASSRLGK
jgi:hypothetical protein